MVSLDGASHYKDSAIRFHSLQPLFYPSYTSITRKQYFSLETILICPVDLLNTEQIVELYSYQGSELHSCVSNYLVFLFVHYYESPSFLSNYLHLSMWMPSSIIFFYCLCKYSYPVSYFHDHNFLYITQFDPEI